MDTEVVTHSDLLFIPITVYTTNYETTMGHCTYSGIVHKKNLTLKCTASRLRRTRLHWQLKLRQHSYKCTKKKNTFGPWQFGAYSTIKYITCIQEIQGSITWLCIFIWNLSPVIHPHVLFSNQKLSVNWKCQRHLQSSRLKPIPERMLYDW